MSKKTKNLLFFKKIPIVLMVIIFLILVGYRIFMSIVDINERFLPAPEAEKLSKITFINVENDMGIEKINIGDKVDMEKFLEMFKDSVRVDNRHSVADFPDKDSFTIIIFNFKNQGLSFRSFYREEANIYIDQPYYRIFKVKKENIKTWEDFIEKGNKEEIWVDLQDIANGKF